MFCSALIGAWHAGQAERGTARLNRSGAAAGSVALAASPLSSLHCSRHARSSITRQSIDHDVQEAAHGQSQHQAGADEHGGARTRAARSLTWSRGGAGAFQPGTRSELLRPPIRA